jgi:hypothetical protein
LPKMPLIRPPKLKRASSSLVDNWDARSSSMALSSS